MPTDIKKPLRKILPYLLQAQKDNLNEADTVLRLVKVFEDVLGWDGMSEISREAQLKNKYVDIALKIDNVTKLLVEAKAAGEKLRDRHVEQAERYASENNFRWVVLTNGVVWNLYHLTFDEGIEYEKAFSIDLSDGDHFDLNAQRLALLHRQAIEKGEHETFWERTSALNPESVGRVLFDEQVLSLIRRKIHQSQGILLDVEDLAAAIHDLFSDDARERVGPPKIRHRQHKRQRAEDAATENKAAGTAPTAAPPKATS
jgi:predicted type IV restriction endonuclease